MTTEAHLATGWVLAHLAGREDRRFRMLVTIAAVIPDIDALSYVAGTVAYGYVHHALGHNVFFSIVISVAAALLWRKKVWKILLFTQLAFYSHYFGDYFLTRFPLQYFWPVSGAEFVYSYRIGLDHPINITLSYLSFVVMIVMAGIYKRTPIEMISPALDERIVNLFRRRTLACATCGRPANERCITCGQPCCMRHGRITRRCTVTCAGCTLPVGSGTTARPGA